jgi:hypothetical protein
MNKLHHSTFKIHPSPASSLYHTSVRQKVRNFGVQLLSGVVNLGGALVFPLEAVAIFAETETVHAMTA